MKTCLNKICPHLSRLSPLFLLALIVLLAFFFRLYGLNWDQGQHLHPDERFLTMIVSAMKIPNTFLDYLNPKVSTMNPYNLNFGFFVYGTFPLYLTKIIGEILNQTDYWNVHFIGRILSALFDIGTVILVYFIANKIFPDKSLNTKYKIPALPAGRQNTPLLAAFLYSIMVLPIQLSHFFTVDTFLNFFLVLSFFLLLKILNTKYLILNTILLGVSFGTALACKISALYFLPIIGLGFLFGLTSKLTRYSMSKWKGIVNFCLIAIVFFTVCLFTFRINQPSAFSSGNFLNWQPNPQLIKNLNELKSFNSFNSWFPPAVQWHSTQPIIFPLKNLILWGLGLPLGIIAIVSVGYTIVVLLSRYLAKNKISKTHNSLFIILNSLITLWILGLFFYQGLQFCKTMRYFLPIYPFLALLSSNFLSKILEKLPGKLYAIRYTLYAMLLIYPVSFLSIYSRPITRVSASKWIYENIPAGSTVTYEEWDDGLPLGLPNHPPADFKTESLMMYDFDTPEKWQKLNEKIARLDYYFISSNRAYGSTMKLPDKYPYTTAFYQSLFKETGNFKKAAEFASYPCFPPFGNKHLFCFNDDSAEEAFTVYDHPKVMIFQKINVQ